MKNKIALILGISILLVVLVSSCGGPKKCNGKRGIRTEMGTM